MQKKNVFADLNLGRSKSVNGSLYQQELKQFNALVRQRLDIACEAEKSKSIVVRRCNRIYEHIIKDNNEPLYSNLVIDNQMSPEMQLMRWVRCMLAREFNEHVSLLLWDYILGGVFVTFMDS